MHVRSIQQADIQNFELIGIEQGIPKLNLLKWIEADRTKLEWCFVVEENGVFLGRIIFGVFEEQPLDLKIWQFLMDIGKKDVDRSGEMLLKESLVILSKNGFKTVEYHMYLSQNTDSKCLKSIFERQGFRIVQEKKNFELELKASSETDGRLSFKKLAELDDEQFIIAIERVTEKTLDRDDSENNAIYGTRKAAEMYFELLKEIDFNKNWWKLAYDSTGEFVGLVVPQQFDGERGAINYIGVAPDQRGKGYIDVLVEEASRVLLQEGIQICIAEIDVQNKPLEKALIRKGYSFKRALTVLRQEMQ